MIKKQFSKTKQMCKVTFTLPKKAAKNAKVVKVLGDFNNWNWRKGVKMTASKSTFKAVVELETGRKYQFRYMIDNKIWENDWAADEYIPNDFGMNNSVVVLPKVKGVPVKKSAVKKVAAKSRAATKKKSSVTAKRKSTTAKRKSTTSKSKSTTAKKKSTTSRTKPVAKKMSTTKKKSSVTAKRKSTTAKRKPTAKKTTAKKSMTKKSMTTKVRVIKQTDLTVIEGVGPKICQLLNKGGVKTFSQMSKCSVSKLKGILAKGGNRYQMHNPSSWPKQAKLAANNKWSDLKKMQAKMK